MKRLIFFRLLSAVFLSLVLFLGKAWGQEAYAVFSDGTLTFYYDKNKPAGAYGMRTTWNDQWSDVTDKITKVVFDKSFDNYRPTSCAYWFYGCSNLTIIEGMKEYINTDNVTSMGGMFSGCSSLTTLDLSNFKTEKVTDMNSMFNGCSSLTTLDLSNFKTDNVTNMGTMFNGCSNLTTLDLSNFKTDNVMYMNIMFSGCSNLQTIYVGDNWTTKNVTQSWRTFYGCYSLYGGKGTAYNGNIIDATYANIDDPENGKPGYFTKSGEPAFVPPIPYAVFSDGTLTFYYGKNKPSGAYGMRTTWRDQWYDVADKITKVVFDKSFADYLPTSCAYWFSNCRNLTTIEGMKEYLNSEKVTNMYDMFYNCSSLTTLDVSNFKTDNVTNMSDMFRDCSSLTTLDVSNFKTENATSMLCMFYNCSSLTTLDVSNFKTENVTNMGYMFYNCSSLTTLDVSNFKTDNVTRMDGMFYNCSSLTTLDVSNFKTDNVTYMDWMFYNCSSLTSLDVSNFKTDNVTKMDCMFSGCSSLTTLDVSNFKTEKVTNMGDMFANCSSLTTLDVSNFKTDNVTSMYDMFYNCSSLTTLDVSNFKTDNVTTMYSMFDGCSSFTTLDVSNFNTEKVTNMSFMFYGCSNFTTLDASNFNTDNVMYMSSMFNGCSSLQTIYVGDNWTTKNVTQSEYMFNGCNNLYGGKGTAYNENFIDATYANIDDPENGKPGYFTKSGEQPWGPVSIDLTTLPNKTEYYINDDLNLEGGELTATFPDNTTKITSLSNAKVSGFDNTKPGEQVLKIVYNGKETEFKVKVVAKPEPEPEPVVENPYTKPELKDGFYQISTAEELLWFVFDVNSGDTKANAALTEDIVINQDCLERVIKLLGISKADGDLTVWQPIGTFEHAFAGIFDGQGHSISGLFINDKTLDNAGLFGAIASEAVVKNLGVVDSYISGGKNVGAICGQSEGKIENCYSLSEVKGTENVNGIAGKVETVSNVENCYYLADIPNADDPQAKTAAEFKSGEVAQLLAKGDKAWKNVKELPGVESVVVPEPEPQIENPDDPETATENITLSSVKIWSFEKTVIVENAVNDIVIVDLTGRVVKKVVPDSNRMEIQLNKGGIYIVKTGLSTKKVSVK